MDFFKKLFTLLATTFYALSSFPVYAHYDYKCETGCCPVASNLSRKLLLDGFYVGGQLGYDTYWVRENISTPATSDLVGNPKINAPSWVEGALLGYGRYLYGPYYIGGEVFINYSEANESYFLEDNVAHYSSKISARASYGIALLPGIGVTDYLLVYIRLGYNWGSFLANESVGPLSIAKKNTVSGPNYGLGMEVLLIDNWSVRAEYTHTNYSSFSTEFGTNFDPSNNQVMVAIIYHFWTACC